MLCELSLCNCLVWMLVIEGYPKSVRTYKAKLLQEEMAKRTEDGLLIKGKEGGSYKELNWSTLEISLMAHLATPAR